MEFRGDYFDFFLNFQNFRPQLLRLSFTTNVEVNNITLQNSPAWTFHLANTTNVHINNISIINPRDSINTDGIDIDCSVNVLVENYFYDGGILIYKAVMFVRVYKRSFYGDLHKVQDLYHVRGVKEEN
jgi:hypothetical protein